MPPEKGSTTKVAHYVDNVKFYEAIVDYRKQVVAAKEAGEGIPTISNYIGECFIKISTNLSYRYNFINYTYKDDMISDGIENCLIAAAKFDPSFGNNAFAYFTQIAFWAFVRRIQKEKKQQLSKYAIIANLDLDSLLTQQHDEGEYVNQYIDYMKKQIDQMDNDKTEIVKIKKTKTAKSSKYKQFDIDE